MGINSPKYAIDTCSITALRRVYPADVFPGAWEFVGEMADSGALISSTEILEEINAQDDEVTDWAKSHINMFYPLVEIIQQRAKEILRRHPNLIDLKKLKSSGDPFLIATAIEHTCTIVTEEKPAGTGSLLLKIPNVCQFYRVPCITLLDMLRAEGIKLKK